MKMILEHSKRLSISNTKTFYFEPDSTTTTECGSYPGDCGQIYDLSMEIKGRQFRILLFDTEFGREKLLNGRFIYGKGARSVYTNCCITVAKALQKFFPDVLGYVEDLREHQILRAGKALTLAPFIEGLKTQGDDFKRKPLEDKSKLYCASSTAEINWGPETARIFSDICPASGSTMEAFVLKCLEETNLKRIIFNCSTSTINALYRVIPLIPENIEVTVIYWEALFSVWRDDLELPGGEVIHGGTVINLNPDPVYPEFNPIAPKRVVEHIYKTFQRDSLELLPDIPGEVGEKIQDYWTAPLTYDFLEFVNAGIDLTKEPWLKPAKAAWDMPGVQEYLRMKAPKVYEKIKQTLVGKTDNINSAKAMQL